MEPMDPQRRGTLLALGTWSKAVLALAGLGGLATACTERKSGQLRQETYQNYANYSDYFDYVNYVNYSDYANGTYGDYYNYGDYSNYADYYNYSDSYHDYQDNYSDYNNYADYFDYYDYWDVYYNYSDYSNYSDYYDYSDNGGGLSMREPPTGLRRPPYANYADSYADRAGERPPGPTGKVGRDPVPPRGPTSRALERPQADGSPDRSKPTRLGHRKEARAVTPPQEATPRRGSSQELNRPATQKPGRARGKGRRP